MDSELAGSKISYNNKDYDLDRHGFLAHPDLWDENFAEGMAKRLGIHEGLSDGHWDIIRYLRNKFLIEKTIPVVVIACADNQIRLGQLRSLFPTGYHRGACKIAGINYAFLCETNIWLTYESTPATKPEYDVDKLGFLQVFEQWNDRFAHWVVRNWDLPEGLTDKHWNIIRYLREYYGNSGTIPTIFDVCKSQSIDLDEFGELFPKGYRRGACRAAGLPFFN